jgi:putative protein kinase ArgK-like GTPase of G3E family
MPNVELKENEEAIRIHDDSEEAQLIMQTYDYYFENGTLKINKTIEQYRQEQKETPEYKKQEIENELKQLDKVISRQTEQLYKDANITITYQPMVDALLQKLELRTQLAILNQ